MPGETSLGAALLARLKNDTGSKLFIKLWTARGHRFDGNYYYPDNSHTSPEYRMTLEQAVAYLIKEDTDALDSKPDRTELSNVLAEPVNDTEFAGLTVYSRSDIKKDLFDDMYRTAAGVHGHIDHSHVEDGVSKPYYLNGLWLTYAEAITIMSYYSAQIDAYSQMRYAACPCRTLLIRGRTYVNTVTSRMFFENNKLEVLVLTDIETTEPWGMFGNCSNLRTIDGIIGVRNQKQLDKMFAGCKALKETRISYLGANISFADSPNLSLDSISFMVTYAQNASPITITLHPTAYARVTDELFALAASKNITIASA